MDERYSMIGFVVIVMLYAVVGLLAAAGAISITRKIGPKAEQVLYGLFLVIIAALYLAFVAYFGKATAWRVETAAVVFFALVGLFGVRLPIALVIGYALHGAWDLVHELQAQGAISTYYLGPLTAVPLAYGVFCAAFDVCIAAYAFKRRDEWNVAWAPQLQQETTPPA